MCCGYGAMLHSRQNCFRPPLSEFSGSARVLVILEKLQPFWPDNSDFDGKSTVLT